MAKRELNYTVGDEAYTHLKFRSVSGSDDYTSVDDPVDNNIPGLIDSVLDKDPLLFSYMNDDDAPEVILCNVDTPTADPEPSIAGISDNPLTSTGRYSVCIPDVRPDGKLIWRALPNGKGMNIRLMLDPEGAAVDVAGNPHGIVKIGEYLYIVDYDSTTIYRVDLAALKAADNGTTCEAAIAIDLSEVTPDLFPEGMYHHGTALVALPTAAGVPFFFALYTNTDEDTSGNVTYQYESSFIRLTVDGGTGDLVYDTYIPVGPNSTGLHPYGSGDDTRILIPAIGGIQKISETNGIVSALYLANAFGPWNIDDTVKQIVAGEGTGGGDNPPPVTRKGSYDIHSVAVSEDGKWGYLITMNYDGSDYLTCWRIYAMNLPALETPGASIDISDLVDAHLLVPVDSGFDEPTSYYCEGVVLNAGGDTGKSLWLMIGNRIRVSDLQDYSYVIKEINAGSGGSLYSPAFNLNSADLIGEMIYQALKSAAPNTRLGRLRGLAKGIRAAKAAARAAAAAREAPEDEDDGTKSGR